MKNGLGIAFQQGTELRGAGAASSGVEELHRERRDVSLCFVVNRRTQTMRVVDFRAGAQPHKLDLVQRTAQEEGVVRAYTVVEREEAGTWAKMGFVKEATIPGFYKRSDGHVLGLEVEPGLPKQSATRIRVRPPIESQDLERSYQRARRLVRGRAPDAQPKVKVALARPQDVERAVSNAQKSERALTAFEPFGRDVESSFRLCTARGGFSLLVGVELQRCFDNALIDVLCAPRGDKEIWLTAAGLEAICLELVDGGMVSAFALAPADSVELTAAFLASGFRRTGRLPNHLLTCDGRCDATVWARKLAEP